MPLDESPDLDLSLGTHFGPRLLPEGGAEFCLWAPAESSVSLRLGG